jgi:hypothetical protein
VGEIPYELPVKSRFWVYSREECDPPRRWWPYIGGDEWDRWTVVLPIPFGGYLVTALWTCRLCASGGVHR